MSPTITRDATRVGVILGTAAYMSPEQARGKKVDRRTDISETGETVVIRASREFEILARNKLDGRFLASPVIASGHLLLRSDDELIAVGK